MKILTGTLFFAIFAILFVLANTGLGEAQLSSYFTGTSGDSGSNSVDFTFVGDELVDGDVVGNAQTCHVTAISDESFNGGNVFSASLPGILTQLSAARDGTVWGVNGGNLPYRLTSGSGSTQPAYSWTQMPLLPNSATIKQVSVGSVNNVWAVKAADGSVWQWNGSSWTRKGTNGNIKEVSVSSWDGTVWAVTNANIPLQWNPSTGAWTQMPANLSWVSVSAYNDVWGIGGTNTYGGNVWHYNPSTNGYTAHNGTLAKIASHWDVENGTTLYGVNSSNQLWSSYLGGSTSNAPWTLLGTATDVSVGTLSDVWQSNSGTLSRYFPTTTASITKYATGTQYISARAENILNNMPFGVVFNFSGHSSVNNSCSVPNEIFQASSNSDFLQGEAGESACQVTIAPDAIQSTDCSSQNSKEQTQTFTARITPTTCYNGSQSTCDALGWGVSNIYVPSGGVTCNMTAIVPNSVVQYYAGPAVSPGVAGTLRVIFNIMYTRSGLVEQHKDVEVACP